MARPLCERAAAGSQELLVPRNRWWVVSWPWRCPLLHEPTKECRLLVAPSQHGRNGLSQIRRVRWFPHSASSHGWISTITLIIKQSTMEERRKRKVNQKARNLFQPNPEYPDSHPEYPGTPTRNIRNYIRSIRVFMSRLHYSHPLNARILLNQ